MERAMKHGEFRIRPYKGKEHGKVRRACQIVGYLNGERIRKRCKDREDALAELNRLQVKAANSGDVRAVNTRLSADQLIEAESAFLRIGARRLIDVVDWYLANYRPPSVAKALAEAVTEYLAAKKPHVEPVHYDDVVRKLAWLTGWFPKANVADVPAGDLEAKMEARGWKNKTWNNVRACFSDFFSYCCEDRRRWRTENPIAQIKARKVVRGLPAIEKTERLREMFEYLETYTGGPRKPQKPGFLVPYFALATFAGLRPSVPDGEIWKIGQLADASRTVDTEVGVIRISPEIAKTDFVRPVKIRPNLARWLAKYPLKEYPLVMPNLQHHVTAVRVKFGLTDDVLRHTWISAHVAQFKSIGEAAIEAGNSEAIIKVHYLNLMSELEAAAFWQILPRG